MSLVEHLDERGVKSCCVGRFLTAIWRIHFPIKDRIVGVAVVQAIKSGIQRAKIILCCNRATTQTSR